MANNVAYKSDASTTVATVATDDVSGVHYQYVKHAFGPDDTATLVTASVGLPVAVVGTVTVDLGANNDVTVTGTVDLGATDNAVLDSIAAATAATQTAVEGTLTVGSHAVTNAGTFAVQVNGSALTALQLLDDAVATDGSVSPTKGYSVCGTDGTNAQIISTNTTGHVNIADGGNTITVDGTVTANLSATDNAVLDAIAASVAGTLTVGSHAVTNTGTFAVQVDGNALTALQLIDDSIFADDAAFTLASSKTTVAGAIRDDTLGVLTAVEGDVVPLRVGDTGALHITAQTLPVTVDIGGGLSGLQTQRVALASDVSLPAGTNPIGKLAANSGVDIGDVDVTSISAGSNLIGDVGLGVRTSGGTSIFRSIDLDEGALEVVKASAGQVYWIHAINVATSPRYVKVYNAASGTIGTGTPVLTLPIPSQGTANGAGFTLNIPQGIAFSTGITIGASTGVADADTGAPGANEVIVNVGYN